MGDETQEDRQGLLSDTDNSYAFNQTANLDRNNIELQRYRDDSPHAPNENNKTARNIYRNATSSRKILIGAVVAVAVILLLVLSSSVTISHKNKGFQKPKDVKIIGVVFFGRAQFVDILDCYLRKNLAVNGGMFDNVLFMKNTDNKHDLAYLDTLIPQVPQYEAIDIPGQVSGISGYGKIWEMIYAYNDEPDTIFVKIDDDVVWVHEDTVPRLVKTLINHPEAHNINANIINSPLVSWNHFHNDAIHPLLPEPATPDSRNRETKTWRISSMPTLSGEDVADEYDFSNSSPPSENHRWLLVADSRNNTSASLMKTPIAKAEYGSGGAPWSSWAIGAQQHYSLLKNLEDDTTDKYWFGGRQGTWNMQYQTSYNLNFMAMRRSSLALKFPGNDDEQALTLWILQELRRPCLVDTHALVAHFSYGPQSKGIAQTDILDRYRAYANEFVCAAGNQKSRLIGMAGR